MSARANKGPAGATVSKFPAPHFEFPASGEEPPAPFNCRLSSGTIALIRCSDQTADAGIGTIDEGFVVDDRGVEGGDEFEKVGLAFEDVGEEIGIVPWPGRGAGRGAFAWPPAPG